MMPTTDGANEAALERSYSAHQPIEMPVAERLLKETKQILDELGVAFFLRQGTCLGAVRDHGFIPWDDDLDIGSVIGLHGFAEESVEKVVAAFRGHGFYAIVAHTDHYVSVEMIKYSIRIDWTCYRVINEEIIHYPGVHLPVKLFTNLREIDFIDGKFLVPNPPEEYLRLKYGAEWMVPKETGYEQDILDQIPEAPVPGRGRRLLQLFRRLVLMRGSSRLRILDDRERPVADAEVVVATVGRFRTDKLGYAEFNLPCSNWYALVIRRDDIEEVLYLEKLAPGETYVYRPDASTASGRQNVLTGE